VSPRSDERGATPQQAALALELRGVTKRFGALTANDAIDFELRRGEVHALLGENGAGKSTLMNIVYGMLQPDAGEVLVGGRRLEATGPRDAMRAGIGMVFQHFMLIPVMTVAENFVLGAEPRTGARLLDERGAERRLRELSDRYGLAVDPRAKVQDITVGQQQRVEILRALDRGADVLVLDEPTAVLTAQETEDLFEVLRGLKANGTSIVFISHKLKEVLALSDRVTVLRRGRNAGTVVTSDVDETQLARLMVGREVLLRVEKPPAQLRAPLLRVTDLQVKDDRGLPAVDGLSLEVRGGEIVAVAGVDGNGQSELIEAITGLRAVAGGTIEVAGRDVTDVDARGMLDAGVAHIAEDRRRRGLVLDFTLAENLALRRYRQMARFGLLSIKRFTARAGQLLADFDVRPNAPTAAARTLSGGNQQKVVIARELDCDPQVLVAAQPTRGLDVGAIEFVHRRLVAERDKGRAVLLVSLELEEVLALADRILVIYEGQIVSELSGDVTEEEIGLRMTGGGAGREVAA
jgi:simple sugar transport system ATP-binding protein